MDFNEKIEWLRFCVDAEGDGGIASLGWSEREELQEFLDKIEEDGLHD